ncbi:LamB/YcsF family protein [Humibacter ginsenosidimutans]|uniref:5-oxoprolinase subunit A n=1 Tax=Humibacter ginsenosidimutans TaxID=2599293 RepID=A0A5B8M605_9MICO|nr:5-oxoprolinase subunit PxpA [Humibacter ginsenosidimutans]QDZ15042.1 LamB/YcsF family protein [Humibacter ginsenosidimutans]
MRTIDLNCDLGESFGAWSMGDDTAMLENVSSANVACGFHGGDPATMLATCRAARDRGVVIGAHVSYRDLAGFGRRFIDVAPADLHADVLYQLSALAGVAASVGSEVRYVKPHGALYNRIVTDEQQAAAVADAVASFPARLSVLGLADSAIERACARRDVPFVREAFIDRAYLADGTLVPRGMPGAVLGAADGVAERAVLMAAEGVVRTIDGETVPLSAASLCVHGDSPDAVAMAVAVRAALTAAGIEIEAFA